MTAFSSPPRFRSWMTLAALAVFFLVASGLQVLSGAHDVEFATFPDEPSHYVTGLMMHEYLAERPLPNPVSFAKTYYHRYPKVALGQWPPLFYCMEAAWMFLFGISPASVLALMALFTACAATLIFWFAWRELGLLAGLAAPLLFLSLHLVQELNAAIMVDTVMTAAILAAGARCGLLVESPRARYAVQFALLAVAGILIKANSMLLALVPALIALFSGRLWALLRSRAVWLAPVIVAACILPWYLAVSRIVSRTMSGQMGLEFTRSALAHYSTSLWAAFGPVLLIAAAGLWVSFLRPAWRRELTPRSAALPAVGIACLIFHLIVPNGPDVRYVLPTIAWLCVLVAAGARSLTQSLPLPAPVRSTAALAAVLLLFTATGFRLHHKTTAAGVRPAVQAILSRVPPHLPAVMVISGAYEGAAIAEIARLDRHRQWIVYRGSKIAASSSWMGGKYRLLVNSPAELLAQLDSVPVHFLLIEDAAWSPPHHTLFRRMLHDFPAALPPLVPSPAPGWVVVQLRHAPGGCIRPLAIEMEHTLGGRIDLPSKGCPVAPAH